MVITITFLTWTQDNSDSDADPYGTHFKTNLLSPIQAHEVTKYIQSLDLADVQTATIAPTADLYAIYFKQVFLLLAHV